MLDWLLLRRVDMGRMTILPSDDLPHVDIDALEAAMRRGGRPTRDDVTILRDGTRLTRRRSPGSGWQRSYVSDAPSQPLSFSDAEAKQVATAMLHPSMFRSAELTTWMTDAGSLDVLHDIPARDGTRQRFDELVNRASAVELAGVRVRVAALDDFVASKQWSAASTTIRVSQAQRDRLRQLADQRSSTMTETLDAALESLRCDQFYCEMAAAASALRSQPEEWARYITERDAWLTADLG